MSKEIDYAKIVKKLNKELEAKYNSREFRNVYEEFGRKGVLTTYNNPIRP